MGNKVHLCNTYLMHPCTKNIEALDHLCG